MAEPSNLSVLDVFLRVWAVAGPLVVGVIGAWWSRRNTLQDREHENEKQNKLWEHQVELYNHENEIKSSERAIEYKRELTRKKYESLQQACVELLSVSHEFVVKQSEYIVALGYPSGLANIQEIIAKAKDNASEARDKLTHNCQIVTLLGNEKVVATVTSFWNIIHEVPANFEKFNKEDYAAILIKYRQARIDLETEVRAQLKNFEVAL